MSVILSPHNIAARQSSLELNNKPLLLFECQIIDRQSCNARSSNLRTDQSDIEIPARPVNWYSAPESFSDS